MRFFDDVLFSLNFRKFVDTNFFNIKVICFFQFMLELRILRCTLRLKYTFLQSFSLNWFFRSGLFKAYQCTSKDVSFWKVSHGLGIIGSSKRKLISKSQNILLSKVLYFSRLVKLGFSCLFLSLFLLFPRLYPFYAVRFLSNFVKVFCSISLGLQFRRVKS